MLIRILLAGISLFYLARSASADEPPCEELRHDSYFNITVVDRATGRGVPLVELRTVNAVRYFTDSNGVVAFLEPGLMGQDVYFFVSSHGYEYPKDGFGNRGKALKAVAGGSARLEIDRVNVAERLYRITGGDIYADSLLVGQKAPLAKPGLNAHVMGQDSVQSVLFGGKIYWFWGDTGRPGYPLGNFQSSGATSHLSDHGGLDPDRGIDLDYFTDKDGFARGVAPIPGEGPTWIDAVVTLKDSSGRERMFAAYAKIRGGLQTYERGLAEFDAERRQFKKVAQFPIDAPFYPAGHAFHRSINGADYIYFAAPLPLLRVKADAEAIKQLDRYEGFTCLVEGTQPKDHRLDRAPSGSLRYVWKKNTAPLSQAEQSRLISAVQLKADEALVQLTDIESGKSVVAHAGSVFWNRYRKRWIMITVEQGGTSFLGEVWFAEADTPAGPWVYARKIVTHDRYSFYNPTQDPLFDTKDGRTIFFEGTYANTFSGNSEQTPRYDYNQIMYKLDLADERLALPAPIYRVADSSQGFATGPALKGDVDTAALAFFAPDRPARSLLPIVAATDGAGHVRLRVASEVAKSGDQL
ncbi:MAG TPA: hypothetical protein VKB78_08330, partial [Pirellulales bacterium]|nr:hypothetical protein [Pirellulales bacterium]